MQAKKIDALYCRLSCDDALQRESNSLTSQKALLACYMRDLQPRIIISLKAGDKSSPFRIFLQGFCQK
jgi:hypothetical protein